jgi:hypothetical protein
MTYYVLGEDEQRELDEIEQALDTGAIERAASPVERKRQCFITR